MANSFSHLKENGDPNMVDVGAKQISKRRALAQSRVRLNAEIMRQFESEDIQTKKGPVFQTAIIAGIMGAKKTSELIPLCHPIGLDNCEIHISVSEPHDVLVRCEASIESKTGVEMEALTGASVAALTIYDMCKAFSHDIEILETKLLEKSGGKNDFKRA